MLLHMGKCCMCVSILLLQPEGATYKNLTFTEVYWISTPNTITSAGLNTFFFFKTSIKNMET